MPARALGFQRSLTIGCLIAFLALSLCMQPGSSNNVLDVKQTAPAKASRAEQKNKYRLPEGVSPLEYELLFEPDLKQFRFGGKEKVKIKVERPCTEIVMNALDLEISNARLQLAGETGASSELKVKLDPETQMARFTASKILEPGIYELSCSFAGKLNEELKGFYRARYEDDEHNKHFLAATQMEPTDARRMFPVFDEPSYKSVFKVSAKVDKSLTAISNAPLLKEESAAETKTFEFEPSPRMSSYLLCLVVGDLKCAGETRGGGVPIRVWAVSGREHLGKYALSEAGKILDFESKYFGIPYLGKKMDLIALPEFSSGAMENIGAVTFHDSSLLVDEKTGSSFQKQDIFGTIAHEFAHQWFGDLVTMAWWDDLWLNESFATWLTTKVEDAIHPEWRSMTESIYSRYGAMNTDSLKSTRAIHASVLNPEQAVEMFDGITYSKGAAVLRMLESYVGENNFREGISKYLKEHEYANASAEEFWTAIAACSHGAPVPEIMQSFVFQPGYPQINVAIAGKKMSLTQYRQFRLGQDKKDQSLWQVPVVIRDLSLSPGNADEKLREPRGRISCLIDARSKTVDFSFSGPAFVNAGGMGYYKTCYEPAHLKKLLASYSKLSTEEKIVLLSDCASLILSGDIAIEDYYSFVHKIKEEKDPMILSDLVSILYGPHEYMKNYRRDAYEKLIRELLLPLKARLDGWDQKADDSQQTKSLRSTVLQLLGIYGQDKKTIGEAFFMFGKYCKDRTAINPDLKHTVIAIAAFNGGAKEYDQLIQLWKTARNPADEEAALGALDSFRQKELARRTIALGMSKEVKLQDGIGLVCGVAYNRYTRDLGWAYIKEHWNEIMNRFPKETLSMLSGIPGAFDLPAEEQKMKTWFGSHPIPFAKARLARSLERMHLNVLSRQRFEKRIRDWVVSEAAKIH